MIASATPARRVQALSVARFVTALTVGVPGAVLLTKPALAQAPMVTATSPTRNAVAAPRTTAVTMRFDQALSPAAATQGALKVFSRQLEGQKAGAASISGNTLSFTPGTAFKAGETVYATVTDTVQSSGGQRLARPYVFQFTTATTPSSGVFGGGFEPNTGANPQGIALGDVDNDGDLDVVTADQNSNTVSIHLNSGGANSNFIVGPQISIGAKPVKLVLGDVDGDGDLDFVTSNAEGSGLTVGLNNGNITFTISTSTFFAGALGSVALGDLDGDGDLDLVAGANGGAGVVVGFNDGQGAFNLSSTVAVPLQGRVSVAVGDVDGDGDLDLLAAANQSNTASVRLNDGQGSFSGSQQVAVGGGAGSVATGDVDSDGDLDLLTATNSGNTVSVRLNDGSGTFGGSQEVAVSGPPDQVVLGDVDGDGDLDLAATSSTSNTVSVCLNNGRGTFTSTQNVAVNSVPAAIALGDADDDGDLDLATANGASNTVSLRLNDYHVLATAAPLRAAPLSLYPNPTAGRCTLTYATRATQAATLQLTDALGRQVHQQAVQLVSGTNQIPLEARPLAAGLYQLTLRLADGQRLTQKVIVQP